MAPRRYSLKDTVLAPIVSGLLFAVGSFLPGGLSAQDLYWQSPFVFTALSGLLVAFACRPVLSQLQWTRPTGFAVALLCVLLLGRAADIFVARLADALGAAPFPVSLPPALLPALCGGLFIAAAMTLLYCPAGGKLTLRALRSSLTAHDPARLVQRLAGIAVAYAAVQMLFGWLDAQMVWNWGLYQTGIAQPNAWLQATAPYGSNLLLYLPLLWLHGLLRLLPLTLIGVTLRGSTRQLTLVFGMLWFVLSGFAPLVVDQPYPSPFWLLSVVLWETVEALLFGWLAARTVRPFYHAPL